MTIENLIKTIPPPDEPGAPFLGPWAPIELELGTALPQDYKDFVRLYGYGYFLKFLGVYVPRSRNPNVRLEHQVGLVCDSIRELGCVPHPLWPEPGGLMPFGGTDNGDTLLWLTRGTPEDWRVAIFPEDSFGEVEFLDVDLTDFLAGLATGALRPEGLPPDLADCDSDRLFVPDPRPPGRVVEVTWRFGSFGGGASGRSRCGFRSD